MPIRYLFRNSSGTKEGATFLAGKRSKYLLLWTSPKRRAGARIKTTSWEGLFLYCIAAVRVV